MFTFDVAHNVASFLIHIDDKQLADNITGNVASCLRHSSPDKHEPSSLPPESEKSENEEQTVDRLNWFMM